MNKEKTLELKVVRSKNNQFYIITFRKLSTWVSQNTDVKIPSWCGMEKYTKELKMELIIYDEIKGTSISAFGVYIGAQYCAFTKEDIEYIKERFLAIGDQFKPENEQYRLK